MAYFRKYSAFSRHHKNSNTAFATILATLFSLFFFSSLVSLGMSPNNVIVATIYIGLILFPPLVYYIYSSQPEFKVAFYKRFYDWWRGLTDRRKIKRQFKKEYRIPLNSKTRVDKRWNFKPKTQYAMELANKRDGLLRVLYKDYEGKCSQIDLEILEAVKNLDKAKVDCELSRKHLRLIEAKLEVAVLDGEKFVRSNEQLSMMNVVADAEKDVLEKESIVDARRIMRLDLKKDFENVMSLISKTYADRYRKYMKRVLVPLYKVKNLKFEAEEMPRVSLKELGEN